jgi:PAS domain S-box-containing protein
MIDINILIIGFIASLGFLLAFLAGVWFKSNQDDLSLNQDFEINEQDQSLIDSLSAAVVVRNETGKIIYCSPYVEVLTGYATKEIYECDEDFFLKICHEHQKERVFRSLKVSELSGEPFQFIFQYFHKSGIEMWAESRTVPTFSDDGTISGTVSVVLDVTAMVTHQHMVEEKNAELKEFTSMVSHDLKAPIYTINGLINVLKEDFGEEFPKAAHEIFETIEKAGHRLESLIQSVLDYARIGAKDLAATAVNLNEVFNDVLAEHHHSIESNNAKIKIENLPDVIGDSSALTQVFSNLIGNAIKYKDPSRDPVIEVSASLHTTPKHVTITVSDNCLGIPEARLDDIWRPFVRVHETQVEGTGIGLATVKKLTERMGGSISVKKNSPNGSNFSVILRVP